MWFKCPEVEGSTRGEAADTELDPHAPLLPNARFVQQNVHIFKDHGMDAITCSAARANLANPMDRVCDGHEPLIITRNGEQSVVMLSLEDDKALEETSYLLRSPTNARRLLGAVAQLTEGKGAERVLAK